MGTVTHVEELIPVQEGLAEVLVPADHTRRGPGKVRGGPFYNAAMATPRHISVLVLTVVAAGVRRVLDGLASTGIQGIRFGLEVAAPFELTLNDRRRESYDLIRNNVVRNGLADVRVHCQDLNALLATERFDYVDVDPFGSPAPFTENALRALRPPGYLAVTATDTAPLAGTYPKTCRRRYDSVPIRGPFRHEMGVRILAGFVLRTAARLELAVRPLLSVWREHYYKLFFHVRSGARRADAALAQLGHVSFPEGKDRVMGSEGDAGPLWAGPLHDQNLLGAMRVREHMPAFLDRLLETWRAEATAPALFYTTDEVAHHLRISPPSMVETHRRLAEAGFVSTRTSFHPKGFKTNAGWEDVVRLLRPA
ncbi:MAG: tRNA (guanine(26)-N(2))-dimethyltransferase [Candidatus Thermoplasmatota archaeon]|nr:tRNA (guanine(26)-N(2))-dimethyltransferase [Candidatus Thermoplasmatota archaeon]